MIRLWGLRHLLCGDRGDAILDSHRIYAFLNHVLHHHVWLTKCCVWVFVDEWWTFGCKQILTCKHCKQILTKFLWLLNFESILRTSPDIFILFYFSISGRDFLGFQHSPRSEGCIGRTNHQVGDTDAYREVIADAGHTARRAGVHSSPWNFPRIT